MTFDMPGFKQVFSKVRSDLGIRLKTMDAVRVDVHVLSLANPMVYWAPPEFGLRLSHVYNDGLGAGRVALGGDHPADMGCERPVDAVERLSGLSPRERGLILGGNAARLLKTPEVATA